jgi:hypothetical protein
MNREPLITADLAGLYAVLFIVSFAETTRKVWTSLSVSYWLKEWCSWGAIIGVVFLANIVWRLLNRSSPRPTCCG